MVLPGFQKLQIEGQVFPAHHHGPRNNRREMAIGMYFVSLILFLIAPKFPLDALPAVALIMTSFGLNVAVVMWFWLQKDDFAWLSVVFFSALQSLVVAYIVLPVTETGYAKYVYVYFFSVPILMVLGEMYRRKRMIFDNKIFVILFLYFVALVVLSDAPVMGRIYFFRNGVFWVVSFLFGYMFFNSRLQNPVMLLIIFYLCFALIEHSFGYEFWHMLFINNEQYIDVRSSTALPANSDAGGLIGNIISCLNDGTCVKRLASFYYAPVNGAYNSVAFTMISYYYWIKSRNSLALSAVALLILCVFLTYVKSSWLIMGTIFFISMTCHLVQWARNSMMLSTVAIVGLFSFYFINLVYNFHGTIVTHFMGLFSSFAFLLANPTLFGTGLGTGGVMGGRLTGEHLEGSGDLNVGAESAFGALMPQIGIIGSVLYVLMMLRMLLWNRRLTSVEATLSFSIMVGFLLTFLIQEESASPASNFLLLAFSGYLQQQHDRARGVMI